ncbi:unnamed protein product [Schistosoma spindalis]|nr:unnamed protein product [Schistosoma spindale]
MQSKQNSFHKYPSFVKSPEEFEKLLLQCPFMSIIHSTKINKNKFNHKINKKSINNQQNQLIKSNDIQLHNQLSIISNENCIEINQSKDNSSKNEEMIIKDTKINHIEYHPENHNEQTITNINYLNSLSSIKKSRLIKEFNSLSIDEQNEENELRYKQLNKLYELIQSDPGRYGQLSIENIIEQMNHFYL